MTEHDVNGGRLQRLAEMGIEVWRLRGRREPRAEPDADDAPVAVAAPTAVRSEIEPPRVSSASTAVDASVATATPISMGKAPAPTPAEAPTGTRLREHFDLLALSGAAGVVVGDFATPEARRLAHGVFMALAGPGANPVSARFEWPPPGGVVTGASAAESACRAFLKGQLDRAGAACLVLLGDPEMERLAVSERLGVPVVRGPDARTLRDQPQRKRDLWRAIAATIGR